jgi:hypothetical protein
MPLNYLIPLVLFWLMIFGQGATFLFRGIQTVKYREHTFYPNRQPGLRQLPVRTVRKQAAVQFGYTLIALGTIMMLGDVLLFIAGIMRGIALLLIIASFVAGLAFTMIVYRRDSESP